MLAQVAGASVQAASCAAPGEFAFLGGVREGQVVLRRLLEEGWRPGVVVAPSDSVLAAAAGGEPWPDGDIRGVPVVKVPAFQSGEAWRALAGARCRGALAVGISEILRTSFLEAFPLGVYGFHASLLPTLAGCAPVNWAIITGLTETGTTLLRYTEHVDGGTVVAQAPCVIGPRETAASLYDELAARSAELWLAEWPRIAAGRIEPAPLGRVPQNPRRRPEDGRIRWEDHTAATLDRWVRALSDPYPGAYFWLHGRRVWTHAAEPVRGPGASRPRLVGAGDGSLTVALPDGRVRLGALRDDDGAAIAPPMAAALAAMAGEPLAALHRGRRVLAIVAHPDDEVLGAGGTLIRHFKEGDTVRVVVVCSADPIRYRDGEHDQPSDFRRALHYLGGTGGGLGFRDQRLDAGSNLELIQAIEREVQTYRPDVVYTHYWGDVNADHVRIAEAVDVATRPYGAPFVEAVYAFETPSSTGWTGSGRDRGFVPTTFVDIAGELDRKLDAMRCYGSELRPYPHPRSLRALRERAGTWGSLANLPAAEALMLLRARR